jgi:hypothetical protein
MTQVLYAQINNKSKKMKVKKKQKQIKSINKRI